MAEEACATVTSARLLGFCRSECVVGAEQGLVIVRSLWRADVGLRSWRPAFETRHRQTVSANRVLDMLGMTDGLGHIIARALTEAGLRV